MSRIGTFIGRLFGKSPAEKPKTERRPIQFGAKYDAASSTPENKRHWQHADGLAPSTANSPYVRKTLRERARYERDNDPHLNGLIKTLAYDMIGTGPRLQLQFDEAQYENARAIEASWTHWCRAVGLADKLRVMQEARPVDGNSFAIMRTNRKVAHAVKLDIDLVEDERVTGEIFYDATTEDDGIKFDAEGNPLSYRVLKQHPGDLAWGTSMDDATVVPAANMLHWFRPTRPGQKRGICEIASSLSVGAQTRRYGQAVLTAAEFAAMLAGVMHTTGGAFTGDAPSVDALDEVEMVRGSLLTLPEGWDAKQFKSEQPTSTYKEFIGDKRGEIGRPLLAPMNVVTGNSSGYNYSSGRLDHIPYHRSVWIERERMRHAVIDRIFVAWVIEAISVGIVDESVLPFTEWEWDWHWDGFTSLDPGKEAAAIKERLLIGLTTLAEECAAEGKNWRDVVDQQAIEKEYILSKGLTPYNAAPPAPMPAAPAAPVEDDEEEPTEDDTEVLTEETGVTHA